MEQSEYHRRKLERTIEHLRLEGVGLETCTACNGSGHYDHNGSPACSSCDGTGKRRMQPHSRARALETIAYERSKQALVRTVKKSPEMTNNDLSEWYARQKQLDRLKLGLG